MTRKFLDHIEVPAPTAPGHPATRAYVDDEIANVAGGGVAPTVYERNVFPETSIPVADDGIGINTFLFQGNPGEPPLVDYYNLDPATKEVTLQVSFPEIDVTAGAGQNPSFIRNVTVFVGTDPSLLTFLYEEQFPVSLSPSEQISLPPRTVTRKYLLGQNERLVVQVDDRIDSAMVNTGEPTDPLTVQGGPGQGGESLDVTIRVDSVVLESLPTYEPEATGVSYGTTGAMVNVAGSFMERARKIELYAANDMFGTPVVTAYNADNPNYVSGENDPLGLIEAYDGNANDHIGANFIPFDAARITAGSFAWAQYDSQPIEVGRIVVYDDTNNIVSDLAPSPAIAVPPIPKVHAWWSPSPNRFVLIGDFFDEDSASGLGHFGLRFNGSTGDAGNDAYYHAPSDTVAGTGNPANAGGVTVQNWSQNIIAIEDTRFAGWYAGDAPAPVNGFYMHAGDFQYYYYEPRLDPGQYGDVDGNTAYPLPNPTISGITLYDAATLASFNPTWDDDLFDGWAYGLSISGTNLVGPTVFRVHYGGGNSFDAYWPPRWANDFENASVMIDVSSIMGETIDAIEIFADGDTLNQLLLDNTTPDLPVAVPAV